MLAAMKTAEDKRKYSREGFLIADAIITKVGDLPYTRGELGLPGKATDKVMLSRPREVLEKALPSMMGAPVTIGHPPAFVNPSNIQDFMVGAVVTKPTIDQSGNVRASVRLYQQDAIDQVERGEHQLSPGFNFVPEFITDDRGVIREAQFNHIAVLPHGRAGEAVRILDKLPQSFHQEKPKMGENQQLTEAIRLAVKDAFGEQAPKGMSAEQIETRVTDKMQSALKPVLDELAAVKEKQAKDEAEAKAKSAEDAKKKEIKEAVDEAVKIERARMIIISDCKPFIAEDQHGELAAMEPEDILRLAIGDAVPDTDKMDLATLNGVFIGMKATGDSRETIDEPTGSIIIRKSAQDMMMKKKRKKTMADIADMRFKKARGMDMDEDEEMD